MKWSVLVAAVALVMQSAAPDPARQSLQWGRGLLEQKPGWYGSPAARAIADAVLVYQSPHGAWPKNTDLITPPATPAALAAIHASGEANTIDNGATTLPMQFLALMTHATGEARYRAAFERGVDYLLAAQYPNGGWPQFFPLRTGYYSRITYNDHAMVNVLTVLRDAAAGKLPYAFVDDARRTRARAAVERGIDLILRTQVRQDGQAHCLVRAARRKDTRAGVGSHVRAAVALGQRKRRHRPLSAGDRSTDAGDHRRDRWRRRVVALGHHQRPARRDVHPAGRHAGQARRSGSGGAADLGAVLRARHEPPDLPRPRLGRALRVRRDRAGAPERLRVLRDVGRVPRQMIPMPPHRPLVLASASPRRAELLTSAGFRFTIDAADVDETEHPGEDPQAYVLRVARDKAQTVASRRITARSCSRPTRRLSQAVKSWPSRWMRQTPCVCSSSCPMPSTTCGRGWWPSTGETRPPKWSSLACICARSRRTEIRWYVASGEPMGKAGAYGIQGRAARFIDRIEGSWSNVVGLPVATVDRLLKRLGA